MEPNRLTPYTAEELYEKAGGIVDRLHVPERWRDDAIQEFVIAAWQAGEKNKPNPRGYQLAMGKGAIQHFVRHEAMMENLGPGTCSRNAERISFDTVVGTDGGEAVLLAETIAEAWQPTPDVCLQQEERDSAVHAAVANLLGDEREAVIAIWVDGASQEDAAARLGKTRQEVRTLLSTAMKRLALNLGEHRSEFHQSRRG